MDPKVRQTLYEMLFDRGYNKIDSQQEDDKVIIAINENTNKRIFVYFVSDAKVSVKKVKAIRDLMAESVDKYACLCLVYKNTITTFAKQFIATDIDPNLHVQAFSEKELIFNVTKHELVPKFNILTSEEKRDVVQKYKTTSKHFPRMHTTDPISRYYGLLPGAMVKVTRKSPTALSYESYRVVY